MKILSFLSFAFIIILLFSSCKKENVTPIEDHKDILFDLSHNIILKTYENLYNETEQLRIAADKLKVNQNQENLELARQAWRNARDPWEQSEGFLFGPVDQKGIDPSIDSWPVNQTDLDAVLKSPNTLTKEYIDGLDGTLKGFHTIEYLLFGENSSKSITEFTQRQFEYLSACTESLHGATESLYFSWDEAHQNFINYVINAGQTGNTIYPSQKSALEELVNGMVVIADEVANGKINEPYSQLNINLEESRFSRNSKKDFADNIRSIKNIYTGSYLGVDGNGISEIIKSKSTTLDLRAITEINEAILAIENIPGTFTEAIFNSKPEIENAQLKVRKLQQTLEAEILPIISNL